MLCVLRESVCPKNDRVETVATAERRQLTGSISGRLIADIANMKSLLGLFAIVALLFVFRATDGHLDNTNGCETNCNFTFDPICGTDDAGKTKMFSNECVLKSENCLYKTNFQRTANGTCP